jgi:hypothetical protein
VRDLGWALGAANRQSGETLGDRYRDFFAQDMLNSEASRLAQIWNRSKLRSLLSEHIEGAAEPRAHLVVADQS